MTVLERAHAEVMLRALGYDVGVDEARVVQRGRFVAAPTAPHFLWHELGHALTYLSDAKRRTPVKGWFPTPAWIEGLGLPECEADQFADLYADLAAACIVDGGVVPGSTKAGRAERLHLLSRVPDRAGRWILFRLALAGIQDARLAELRTVGAS